MAERVEVDLRRWWVLLNWDWEWERECVRGSRSICDDDDDGRCEIERMKKKNRRVEEAIYLCVSENRVMV